MFSFRIGTSAWDLDQARFVPLLRLIRKMRAEVEREASTQRLRCEKARCSAAFALEALDSDPDNSALEHRVHVLTETLMDSEQRLGQLEREAAFLSGLERELLDFTEKVFTPHPPLSSRMASSLPNR